MTLFVAIFLIILIVFCAAILNITRLKIKGNFSKFEIILFCCIPYSAIASLLIILMSNMTYSDKTRAYLFSYDNFVQMDNNGYSFVYNNTIFDDVPSFISKDTAMLYVVSIDEVRDRVYIQKQE